ncbi:hypothetical protein JSE7799_01670 [Jannaschia seosinensis]|uniref:DUF3618 domain-containing protein n=1 Tax=Jannaschia seosinensis TaxID=313367 RepID=A0A0M7B999_9RHOB|nr:DUF3618 domain-containing protein [Jannaschia seosinensis]CUH38951.1 hypothetical protein JSE7799_01670 [Jannaschia seosinensis]
MAENRTPDQIERQIEAERSALARSIDELQERFTPEAMVDQATAYVREHGRPVASRLAQQAKDNPLALALTGVGIAWLVAGPVKKRERSVSREHAISYDRREDYPKGDEAIFHSESPRLAATPDRSPPDPLDSPTTRHEPRPAWDHTKRQPVSGFREERPPMGGFERRIARARGEEPAEPSTWDRISSAARRGRDKAKGAISNMTSNSDNRRSYGRQEEEDRSLYERLAQGTERMSDAARDRVVQARAAAWDAQRELSARTSDVRASGRNAYMSQPLLAGVIAFGIGAVIGASLPRTQREDRYLGSYRDRAVDEAERIFHEESAKLRAVAEAAMDEAKDVATETMHEARERTPSGEEAVDKAENKAKSAADRVKSAAEEEAERQDLGGSVSS